MCGSGRCDLMVGGGAERLLQLRDSAAGEGTAIDLARLLPPPPDLDAAARHRWRSEHWGAIPRTGLRAVLVADVGDGGVLAYTMSGLDHPPTALVAQLAAQHPALEFTLIHQRNRLSVERRYTWIAGRQIEFVDFDQELARMRRCGERPRGFATRAVRTSRREARRRRCRSHRAGRERRTCPKAHLGRPRGGEPSTAGDRRRPRLRTSGT